MKKHTVLRAALFASALALASCRRTRQLELIVEGSTHNVMRAPNRTMISFGALPSHSNVEAALPWHNRVTVGAGQLYPFSVQGFDGDVSCRLVVDGVEVSRARGSGPLATADCSAYIR